MQLCCPCCGKEISLQMRMSNRVNGKEVLGRFPPTWKEYPGKGFEHVWNKDPEYIKEVIKRVHGKLHDNLVEFLSTKN